MKELFEFNVAVDLDITLPSSTDPIDSNAPRMFYNASIKCQYQLKADEKTEYSKLVAGDGDLDLTLTAHREGNPLASCRFNLPVLEVQSAEPYEPTILTSCIINKERDDIPGAKDKDLLGINVLPDYLKDVFGNEEFCKTECERRTCLDEDTAYPQLICTLNKTKPHEPLKMKGRFLPLY